MKENVSVSQKDLKWIYEDDRARLSIDESSGEVIRLYTGLKQGDDGEPVAFYYEPDNDGNIHLSRPSERIISGKNLDLVITK